MRQKLVELDARWTGLVRVAERPGMLRRLAAVLAHSGDSWFWLAGLGLVWWLGTELWQERARVLAAGVLVTAIVVLLIKFTVRRKRPEGEWGHMYRNTDPHSFPSGHAARAAMLAVLAISLGPAWFGILIAAWAPMVALARAAMGVHYISDVIAGTLLGLGLGFIFTQFL